uniref:Fibronectin type-III domain-containing protein n=1 Tax=Knipowitschia caucasica TaxID=637954 RepID=A0AAV2K5M2_KNICA
MRWFEFVRGWSARSLIDPAAPPGRSLGPGAGACPPGSYKMSSRQQECFSCPENSVAEEEGSIMCVCKEDHFRTPLDLPSAACTRPPSPPRDLSFSLSQSTLVLEWSPPSDSGGRVDLSYTVSCQRCGLRQCEPCGASVGFVPQQGGLTDRTVSVVNLLPNSNYTFTVEALNGVSELLPNKRFYAQVNVSTSLPGEYLQVLRWSQTGSQLKHDSINTGT